ncbi:hypothetical protein GT034_15400, partial [Streptomyces sp. SID2563]|nr:hypothetical protein [Streptomyces sp. SID2563]
MLVTAAVTAVLALTATACGPTEDDAKSEPSSSASAGATSDGKIAIPDDLKDRLKEHGIDIDKWKGGEWKNWDKDKWLREA